MQSVLGSLRQAGPSKRHVIDECRAFWGVGDDDLSFAGHYRFRVLKGRVQICGITLSSELQEYFTVASPVAPYPVFTAVHNELTNEDLPSELNGYFAVIEVVAIQFTPDISVLAPPFTKLWHPLYQHPCDADDFRVPKSWQLDLPFRQTVILGPKNSGKSCLARFLCNKLLQDNVPVYYLELDPGQPEFTTPGCLSLHEIKEFNFSPGCYHPDFRNTLKCYYLGYVSPGETPSRYLELCHSLINFPKKSGKLIINTPGWTKGLGLELNTAIVGMAESLAETNVIHLGESDSIIATEVEAIGEDSTTITQGGFSSAELRSLQIMIYMHQHYHEHLTEWSPYEVSLNSVKVIILDDAGINPEDWAVCVEGTIVAMVTEPEIADPEDMLENCDCIGMAVIQKVNRDSLNLLVPVPLSTLHIGDRKLSLVRGRVQLPLWEVFNKQLGKAPWVSTGKPRGIGGAYTKFRRNIQR